MIAMYQVPELLKKDTEWDENFALLEQHVHDKTIEPESPEFWLVTADAKLNQWLVYTRIELKKERRQHDQLWIQRRERLEKLGIRV